MNNLEFLAVQQKFIFSRNTYTNNIRGGNKCKNFFGGIMNHIDILEKLLYLEFEGFLVGGSIRDKFLGKDPYDFDIVTNCRNLEKIFKNQKIKLVGKSFNVFLINGIEVASYRKDVYFGFSDKNCQIDYAKTIEEDLSRRDLTINSMAHNPFSDRLVDPFGGMNDLNRKIIRFTGNAKDRILEDPNRIIRACRFLCMFEGEGRFSRNTLNAMIENTYLIKYIKPERIRLEILKAMKHQHASIFFSALEIIGCLKMIFPELSRGVYHNHGKYHVEDVYEHSMLVGDNISPKYPLIKLAGYLHDIGKPASYNANTCNFIDHEKYGYEICMSNLKNLRFSNEEIKFICNLIRMHMTTIKNLKMKTVRQILHRFEKYNVKFQDFLRLKIADRQGCIVKDPYKISEIKRVLELKEKSKNLNETFKITDLKINGWDLMELGVPKGPMIGFFLKTIYNDVLNNPELNDREVLLEQIKMIK